MVMILRQSSRRSKSDNPSLLPSSTANNCTNKCEFERQILDPHDLGSQRRGMSSSEVVTFLLWPCVDCVPALGDSAEATTHQRALDWMLGSEYLRLLSGHEYLSVKLCTINAYHVVQSWSLIISVPAAMP